MGQFTYFGAKAVHIQPDKMHLYLEQFIEMSKFKLEIDKIMRNQILSLIKLQQVELEANRYRIDVEFPDLPYKKLDVKDLNPKQLAVLKFITDFLDYLYQNGHIRL